MKALLTSSLGGIRKENGMRFPAPILTENGLSDTLKKIWIKNARVLMICSDPEDFEKNDSVARCFREAFPMSGFSVSSVSVCDGRNPEIADSINAFDVLVLMGGHVPTQNQFLHKIHLKENLTDFGGIVVAWSAGSMNCAKTVYAIPELDGEALDPAYKRWIPGLGLTGINIFPHFQSLRDEVLDGLKMVEDIVFEDSKRHEVIAINDGSYILINGEKETLFGESYRIKNGVLRLICRKNESIALK